MWLLNVHDGELRAGDLEDFVQQALVAQVSAAADEAGEVLRDEDCGVAVLVVVGVAGQADDSVVRDANAAAQVEPAHMPRLIRKWKRMRHLGVYTCLGADSEVVDHAVVGGEVFRADGA